MANSLLPDQQNDRDPQEALRSYWKVIVEMDKAAHERIARTYPRFVHVVDKIGDTLHGFFSAPAFAVLLALALVVLVASGVVSITIGVSCALLWIVAVMWLSSALKQLTIPTRAGIVLIVACILAFGCFRFRDWSLRNYLRSLQQPPEQSKPESPKFPAPTPEVKTEKKPPTSRKGPVPPPSVTPPVATPAISVPALHKTDSFFTYVVVDPTNERYPLFCSHSFDRVRLQACIGVRQTAIRIKYHDDDIVLLSKMLQHYLVSLVLEATTTGTYSGTAGTRDNPRASIEEIPPVDVPDMETYILGDLLPDVSDRNLLSWPLDEEAFQVFLKQTSIRLPKDTTISFVTLPPFLQTWPSHYGSYILRLDRKGHYKLDLHVTPFLKYEQGTLPDGYTTGDERVPQAITYPFHVEMDCTIQRGIDDPEFVPSDYEQWAKALFAQLRRLLEG
jgi:hypothetical protein